MTSILRTLRESDPALLTVLAEVWDVTLDEGDDIATRIDMLTRAMLRAANADHRQG